MDQHNIVPVKVLFQLVYTVSDGSLTVFTAGYNIFQLCNVELIRIGLQHGLPAVYTYDGDRIDLGMTLKCLQGVHNDRPFIYRQNCFGMLCPMRLPAPPAMINATFAIITVSFQRKIHTYFV